MKKLMFLLPFLVLGLASCGPTPKGPQTIVVKEGNAITADVDATVEEKAVVLSTVLSTDKTTKGDYNSVILGNEKGYIAVSTFGLDAKIVTAWKEAKVGDTLRFSGTVAASTGGEFGKGGIKQVYPTAAYTLLDKEADKLIATFPAVTANNVVDLSDMVIDADGNVTTESEHFRTWYNSYADEVSLFGHRVTFKNVKIVAPYGMPGADNTNQGYFMTDKYIVQETISDKTSAVRASIYHASLGENFDLAGTYNITAVMYGANKPMHTAGQKPIIRFGVAPAMEIVPANK